MARREREAHATPLFPSSRRDIERALEMVRATFDPSSLEALMADPGNPADGVALAHDVLDRILGGADER